ncbi:MAG: GNAT family N-acetyltransferase [Acholeplasmataceae bacterium]|nr:GNAT family N-acetyltransferase [Acholeplasmataceae bacterium]
MIFLKELDRKNLFEVIKMHDTLTEYQKKCVAPNVVSIAQAYVNPQAWPRVIYHDDEIIGFVMISTHDDDIPKEDQPSYYLWRFMIKKDAQNLGYGKQVLDMIIQKAKDEHQKFLYTSCEMEGPMPYQFYISYGFIDTGINDGEQILKLNLN